MLDGCMQHLFPQCVIVHLVCDDLQHGCFIVCIRFFRLLFLLLRYHACCFLKHSTQRFSFLFLIPHFNIHRCALTVRPQGLAKNLVFPRFYAKP